MPVSDALRSFIASADHGARPPLDVHPWWGRRHHDIMRGILVSALASPVADFTALATGAAAFPGTVVLDPFAGSGTAVIEALRLGCRPIGIDLNPVAWWIMRNRLLRVDLAALDAAAQGIHDELAARTAPLYSTRCDDFCFHVGAVLRARPTSTQEQTIELLWGEFVKRFSRAYPHVIADDGTAVSVGEAVDWVYALSSVTPAAGTSLAALAEAQALRKQLDGRDPSDADFATATDAIARKLAHEVSPDQAAEIRAWFRQAYGEALWDKLEPETREFLVGAEFLYRQCAGQDIDFGAVAVSFTKPLENELRKKFAPRLAAYAATRKIDVPPKAGTQKLDWRKLADGDVTLGNIEKLLSALDLPENAPVAEYLGSRAAGTGTYARERLPRVLKQFRENGRNAGAHIEPVEAAVVKGFREVLLATDEHVMHWVEL